MTKPTNPWALSLLWINLAVAIVILVGSVTGRFASLHELSRVTAYALVYANLTGLFGTLAMSGLVKRLAPRGLSLRFVVPVGIVAFTALGGLLVLLGSLCLRLKGTANTELTVARDFKARMAGLAAPRRG